ncbi:MAG: hypothetical protein WA705_07135 [Candidatus Ozemobacteraceae bacterium]
MASSSSSSQTPPGDSRRIIIMLAIFGVLIIANLVIRLGRNGAETVAPAAVGSSSGTGTSSTSGSDRQIDAAESASKNTSENASGKSPAQAMGSAVPSQSPSLAAGKAGLAGTQDPLAVLRAMQQRIRMLPPILRRKPPVLLVSTATRNIFQWRLNEVETASFASLSITLPPSLAPMVPVAVQMPRINGTFMTGGEGGAFVSFRKEMFLVHEGETIPGTSFTLVGSTGDNPHFIDARGEQISSEEPRDAGLDRALEILRGKGQDRGYPITDPNASASVDFDAKAALSTMNRSIASASQPPGK